VAWISFLKKLRKTSGEGGELVGLVTLDDILMLLCVEFNSIGRLLARETPAAAAPA
jgi:hypothetical protein